MLDPGYWILVEPEESALRPNRTVSSARTPA